MRIMQGTKVIEAPQAAGPGGEGAPPSQRGAMTTGQLTRGAPQIIGRGEGGVGFVDRLWSQHSGIGLWGAPVKEIAAPP